MGHGCALCLCLCKPAPAVRPVCVCVSVCLCFCFCLCLSLSVSLWASTCCEAWLRWIRKGRPLLSIRLAVFTVSPNKQYLVHYQYYLYHHYTHYFNYYHLYHYHHQGCTNCGILASWLQENGERMRKLRGNGEKMRKWWERVRKCGDIHSLHFFIFSLFPPSLSIFYIKNCLIFRKMLNMTLLSWMLQKHLTYVLWEKNLGRIRCEKAPQVVLAWLSLCLSWIHQACPCTIRTCESKSEGR